MIDESKAIQLIQQKIDEIDIDQFTIGPDRDNIFNNWKESTYELLVEIFNKDHIKVLKFLGINKYGLRAIINGYTHDNIEGRIKGINYAYEVLNECLDSINTFGLRNNSSSYPNTNVVVNNHNQQSQEMNVRIDINYVFSNLNEKEKQELKDQLKKYQDSRNINSLIDYLKTLGQGVVESVLANILTNPMFINQISQQI
jgi:hypothetical protein